MPPRRRSPRTTPHHHHQPPSSSSSSSSSSTVRRSPRLTLSSPTHLALVLYHHPLQSQQQPQPLKIHKPRLLHLLHASSNTPLRRSPRLLGASIGLSNGRCGSQLLLRLPEKEACKLARECLDDRDLSVKRLRSRTLRPASGSGSAGQNSTLHRKRMRDSGQNFDQAPVNWSDRISDGSDDLRHLALPSLEMEGGLEGKRRNLDYRRNSDGTSVNRGFQRRSTRFSGEKSGKPLSGEKSIGDNYGKLGRKSQEKVILALPSSSMAEKSRNIDKVHSRKTIVLPDDTPENAEFRQCSSRVSGEKAVQSSSRKELSDKDEEKEEKETKDVLSSSPSSSMVEPSPCIELLNSTPERSDDSAFRLRVSAMMEEIFGTFEEEKKVVRRSPRGLSSICLVDDYQCDEMKEMTMRSSKKKKKKEQEKVAKETTRKKSKASGSSPVSMDGEDKIKEELAGTETETETERESKSCFFVGEAVPEEEAHKKWGWRYQLKNRRSKGRSLTANVDDENEPILEVKCHYAEAQINGCTFHLGDCALIRGEEGQGHVGRILEFFQSMEGDDYFRVQWFYKAEDTVMKSEASFHDKKRVFYSTIMNDNMLDCIISKLNVAQVTPELILKTGSVPPSDFYYDMEYCLDYSTFRNLPRDTSVTGSELSSISCPKPILSVTATRLSENTSIYEPCNTELTMLDVYAGCGAMSTGLCIGAKLSGINLVTRWAIDADNFACESLRLNHPETHVKNEAAEDFLELLKHWEQLCNKFVTEDNFPSPVDASDSTEMDLDAQSSSDISDEELEVSSLVDICYGDIDESGKQGLKFKVRWKGYDSSEDTWEPIEGLSNCEELIQEFVLNGFKNKILPLPGDVDVICGGPPCQGISGYNRFRCVDDPLSDERNRQLIVFMNIVEFLKPKFVLMENVTDILRLNKGSLGRYALSRLVHMNYQARVGIMAAGCFGLPQFRLRVFFWGALHSEELPQFPLPTHDVVVRYWPPPEFERNIVAYDEGQQRPELEDAVLLTDAISDLPSVTNYESSDEMPYNKPPETEFQKYIRSINHGFATREEEAVLYDHRPHQLFEDDYIRVCQIPRRKGANFRDLPGIVVGDDNVVRRDPNTKPVLLPSGRPMVPEYVFTFEHGKSRRPFGRLWWDETMGTVVTYPNCHSQVVLHPEQDRLLTVRECARLQGFPDSYRFCGTVKKRYRQVGNAVAIPVAKALGYALGMASQRLVGKEPLITLPPNFTYSSNC